MAVFTRINGDAAGVVNVDAGRSFANATIINTGIAAPLTAYKLTFPITNYSAATPGANLAAELTTGGAVETIIRFIEGNATVLAYQVDNYEISVLTERSGWASDTALQNTIKSLVSAGGSYYANITSGNVWLGSVDSTMTAFTVSSSGGIKLA
jgi:hypothetical protein